MKSFQDAMTIAVANYHGSDPTFGSKLAVFAHCFGTRSVTEIKPEDVEIAIDHLVQRGRIYIRRTRNGVIAVPTGIALSPATLNRHISALGTMYNELRRLRITPRGFISPTKGVERNQSDTARTLQVTTEDIKRLIAACRLSLVSQQEPRCHYRNGLHHRLASG